MKKNKTELLIDRLKKDLSDAKKDKTLKNSWDSDSWAFEEGYLISYENLEQIVGYIKDLRKTNGTKPVLAVVAIDRYKNFDAVEEIYCDWYKCPSCKSKNVMVNDNYCSNCGCKYVWSGNER